MRVTMWGVRGSIAVPSAPDMRYGGNTSSIGVTSSAGDVVVIDAGTGVRLLGERLMRDEQRVIHLLVSHLHVDHLEGLGFFAPIWSSDVELHIWGPPSPEAALADRIARYFSPPLFPVHIGDVPAQVHFHDAPERPVELGGITVTSRQIRHPGPTVGYRLEEDGNVLAYLTDHEPGLDTDVWTAEASSVSGLEIARDADVLIHDCQYGDAECDIKTGWGHSSPDVVAALAKRAGVDKVVLFHHDPARTDEDLESMRREVARRLGVPDDRSIVAKEGMEIVVGAAAPAAEADLLATAGVRRTA